MAEVEIAVPVGRDVIVRLDQRGLGVGQRGSLGRSKDRRGQPARADEGRNVALAGVVTQRVEAATVIDIAELAGGDGVEGNAAAELGELPFKKGP